MNEHIQKLALEAGIINYIDLETPRRYFIDGNADLEELNKFAELIIQECAEIADNRPSVLINRTTGGLIKQRFGVDK